MALVKLLFWMYRLDGVRLFEIEGSLNYVGLSKSPNTHALSTDRNKQIR